MIVRMSRHAANANQTVSDCGCENRIRIYTFVQKLPKKLAHQLFIINNDRNYRCDSFQQAKAEPLETLPYLLSKPEQSIAPFRFPFYDFDRFQNRGRVSWRQRRRVYESPRMMLDKFDDLAARSNKAAN